MSRPNHLDHLSQELATFKSYLGSELTAPIEHCGDWTLYELAQHVGRANRWAAGVVTEGRTDFPTAEAPREPDRLVAWFGEGSAELLTALAVPPETPAWSFFPPATVAFWRRRRCFDTLVHRWDAEHALGLDTGIDPALATDGVAEVFDTMAPFQIARGEAPEPTEAICLVSDTGSSWRFGPGEPLATATAPAADLLLMLWKRRRPDHPSITWSGDRASAERILAEAYTP